MSDKYFLFAQPSFLEGMARVLDLGNTLNVYNDSPTEKIADARAIFSDWSMVGQDIEQAISENREAEIVEKKSK